MRGGGEVLALDLPGRQAPSGQLLPGVGQAVGFGDAAREETLDEVAQVATGSPSLAPTVTASAFTSPAAKQFADTLGVELPPMLLASAAPPPPAMTIPPASAAIQREAGETIWRASW